MKLTDSQKDNLKIGLGAGAMAALLGGRIYNRTMLNDSLANGIDDHIKNSTNTSINDNDFKNLLDNFILKKKIENHTLDMATSPDIGKTVMHNNLYPSYAELSSYTQDLPKTDDDVIQAVNQSLIEDSRIGLHKKIDELIVEAITNNKEL